VGKQLFELVGRAVVYSIVDITEIFKGIYMVEFTGFQ
jgi:hypothetical protein